MEQTFLVELVQTDCIAHSGNVFSVMKNGNYIGHCRIVGDENKVEGIFTLEKPISKPHYLKYTPLVISGVKGIANIELFETPNEETVQKINP